MRSTLRSAVPGPKSLSARRSHVILAVEPLDGRVVPAVFLVNTTADAGDGVCDVTACTLREAINAANATAGPDTIDFAIPGVGVHTINPTSPLPAVKDA